MQIYMHSTMCYPLLGVSAAALPSADEVEGHCREGSGSHAWQPDGGGAVCRPGHGGGRRHSRPAARHAAHAAACRRASAAGALAQHLRLCGPGIRPGWQHCCRRCRCSLRWRCRQSRGWRLGSGPHGRRRCAQGPQNEHLLPLHALCSADLAGQAACGSWLCFLAYEAKIQNAYWLLIHSLRMGACAVCCAACQVHASLPHVFADSDDSDEDEASTARPAASTAPAQPEAPDIAFALAPVKAPATPRLRTRLFAARCVLELPSAVGSDPRHFDAIAAQQVSPILCC